MDSFELNKIAGAVLATGLLVMALSITSEIIYEPQDLRENGYVIAVNEAASHGGTAATSEAAATTPGVPPIAVRLQTADVAHGQAIAKKCLACHTLDKGGPAKVGPNLYGIVDNHAAHMQGFKYSSAMLDKQSAGMTWTFAELDKFLTSPKAEVPGTLMSFAGLKKPSDRADVIAYLRTLSDSPVPLPAPPAASDTQGSAPSAGTPSASSAAPQTNATTAPATSEAAAAPPGVPPIAVRLQTADVAAGKAVAKKCLACHSLDKGGPAKVGPNLYGIVDNHAAHMEGFKYSSAMLDEKSAGMTWTYAELDKFLTSPRTAVPGTMMSFAGLKKPEDRANVIAYLRTLSDSPVPLPAPDAQGSATSAGSSNASSGVPQTDATPAPASPPAVQESPQPSPGSAQ